SPTCSPGSWPPGRSSYPLWSVTPSAAAVLDISEIREAAGGDGVVLAGGVGVVHEELDREGGGTGLQDIEDCRHPRGLRRVQRRSGLAADILRRVECLELPARTEQERGLVQPTQVQ